ncbi:hypothetical protein CYMTET_52027 [Cymbomonas tetramitiformis]|uniref:Uncharacterized protein n=1 Tax=Cymbomonas tetramitiformis TaxID=36881 RepID=A0AAE0ET49_9CHLO|nr:hypothetical protein CYMTET_52027 [Cymbomonas tetramitiformis]
MATAAPAAQSAGATFLATIRTLTRERFDQSVAKHVTKKCFQDKYDRFTGCERHAAVLFAKLIVGRWVALFGHPDALLGVRILAKRDPQESVAIFNSALASTRRKTTFCDEEVKSLFIDALDRDHYAPVVNRTGDLVHAFDVPVTRTFMNVVSEDPEAPGLRRLFNFGA